VLNRVSPFLIQLQEFEVSTLIECTPAFLGRDPVLLKNLSEETGIQLMTNTGFYGARQNHFIHSSLLDLSIEEIAAIWIQEFNEGIEDTGIKPGFIKIAVDDSIHLSDFHKKIISAAAVAHNQTGLVIASHTGPDGPAFEQIKVLQSYGINPSHFIWVHAHRGTLEGNVRAAKKGAWISLDNVNAQAKRAPEDKYSIDWYADRIAALKESGLLGKVLISHDAGWYSPGEEDGGNFRGYTGIFESLIPALKDREFSEDDLDLLLKQNPAQAFSLKSFQ
jgi:phosphotriesterase-related protein